MAKKKVKNPKVLFAFLDEKGQVEDHVYLTLKSAKESHIYTDDRLVKMTISKIEEVELGEPRD